MRAEVIYATRSEMAERLDDMVRRRIGITTCRTATMSTLRDCARLMAADLGWSLERIEEEVRHAQRCAALPWEQGEPEEAGVER